MNLSKRILASLLCGVMACSIAACAPPAAPAASKGETPEASSAVSAENDFSEKQTISLATIQIQDGKDYSAGDDFTKAWTEKFNVEWEITSLTWENWAERLRVWINSDDMPDWVVWNYVHGEAVTYAQQGLLKQLPDTWKGDYPNLAKAYTDTPMNEGVEKELGGTFCLFRPVFSANRPAKKLSTHISLYARQDWADAIKFPLKDEMKWSEIIDFAKQLKEKDPGKVGENFYPIVIRSANNYSVQSNSTYCGHNGTPFYKGSDGKYQWGGASPDTLTGLKLYSQMFTEGLLHPEFYTLQEPDDKASLYVTGTSGIVAAEGMAGPMEQMATEMKANLNLDYDKVVRPITMLGEDGKYHGATIANYWCANAFSPNIDDKKLSRLLTMMDYSCTKEGQEIIRMGIKDKDWKVGDDGEYISLLEEGQILNDQYAIHPVYGNMMILSDD
ncbi:MAG: ABC transporter substrate-binding protein, partial [Oscillospiraceae bacterium]